MRLGALRAIASLSLAAALSCTGAGLATAQETAQGAMLADEGLPSPVVEAAGHAPLTTDGPVAGGTAANGQATGGLAANDVTTGAVTDAVTGETAASDAVADDSAANGPVAGGLAPDGGVTSGDAVQAGGTEVSTGPEAAPAGDLQSVPAGDDEGQSAGEQPPTPPADAEGADGDASDSATQGDTDPSQTAEGQSGEPGEPVEPGDSNVADGSNACDEPGAASDSSIGDSVVADGPSDLGEPALTDETADAEEPGDADKTGDADEPGDTEEPGDTGEPGDTEEPGEEPGGADDPVEDPAAGGWQTVGGQRYYYKDGEPLTGEQRIGGAWYYLDPDTGAMQTGFVRQQVTSGSGSFKVAYYGEDGKRLSGVQEIGGEQYFFSDATGALTTGFVRPSSGGVIYFFDITDGQKVTGEALIHDGWRYLDPQAGGALATGYADVPVTSGGTKTVYYDTFDGSMVYGTQFVEGRWRVFDDVTGELQTYDDLVKRVIDVAMADNGESEAYAWSCMDQLASLGGSYCEYGPCVSWVWHCFYEAGLDRFFADGLRTCWPNQFFDYMLAHGQISQTPTVGSVVFFDYPNAFGAQLGLSCSHAEIVLEVYSDHLVTIGALEGGVQVHWFDYSYISGYGIPSF